MTQKESSTWLNCGEEFEFYPQQKVREVGKFCSPKCSGQFRKGTKLGPRTDIDLATTEFWSRTDRTSQPPCWLWTGPQDNYGYGAASQAPLGVFSLVGKAHRI